MPKKLSPADVTSICDAAAKAWKDVGANKDRAEFEWRGRRYVVRHSSFRLMVDTLDGKPVAARYD